MRRRNIFISIGVVVFSVLAVCAIFVGIQFGVFLPKPAPHPTPAETRDGRWEQDIDYFASQLPRLHNNLFATLSAEEFQAAIDSLRNSVPTLSDQQIYMELARIVTRVSDGHTTVGPWIVDGRLAPVGLQWFSDGLFVLATGEGFEELLKAKVLEIGGVEIAQVMESMGELVSADNEPHRRHRAAEFLRRPPILYEIGFATTPDSANFTLVTAPGDTVVASLSAIHRSDISWVETSGENIPLYRTRSDENYWYEYLPDSRTLFFKYNRCRGFFDFRNLAGEMKDLINAGEVDRLVIDFRGNGGGNSIQFTFNLLRYLRKHESINDADRLFSVIDVGTFSSAKGNSIALERETNATTVGEPTGGKPNQFGEIKPFYLPNSGMGVWYSTKYFVTAPELGEAPSFKPEVHIPLTSSDYFSGRDPVMEWILGEREEN